MSPGPMLCRRAGIKRLLGVAALVYGGGCLVGGLAPTMALLLAARFAQGLGGGTLLSLCYLAIQEWFEQSWWSRLFGIVAFIWGAGSLLGPLIGGIFAGLHAWRLTFFAFAGQAAALAAWRHFRLKRRPAIAATWWCRPHCRGRHAIAEQRGESASRHRSSVPCWGGHTLRGGARIARRPLARCSC